MFKFVYYNILEQSFEDMDAFDQASFLATFSYLWHLSGVR